MPEISNYTETTSVVLGEAGKYFFLLLFSVLAIRLWRRWAKNSTGLFLACLATLIACGIGYFSMCQSLGKLYSHYGMIAFRENRLLQAVSLFQTSSEYWKSADVLGKEGVCLLFVGRPDDGIRFVGAAKSMRNGAETAFEEFYEGFYYFSQNQRTNAVPLLNAALSSDPSYLWNVTKIFAIMLLDEGRPAAAADWMKPFAQAEVTECDQAYITASLELAAGKKAEARALVDKFTTGEQDNSVAGKDRFEKLRAQLQK